MQDFTYSDFEIIDAHSHIFPERISEKAAANIGAFYDLPMYEIGDSLRLIESGKKIGVKKYLVCSTATSKEQTESINNFIKAKCDRHSEFFGFGTLHPKMDNMEEEVERIISMGLHGIKIHPDFQKFNIDDKQAYKIYELIETAIIGYYKGEVAPFIPQESNASTKVRKETLQERKEATQEGKESWKAVSDVLKEQISSQQKQIDTLTEQLKKKDEQLTEKDKQIEQLIHMVF